MVFIQPLREDEAPVSVKSYFENGDPGPLVSTIAHVPELLMSAMPFIGSLFGASAVDFRTKEMVILRTSAIHQCQYCVETHTSVAMDADLTREQLQVLRLERENNGVFTLEKDLALLRWADAVAKSESTISKAQRDAIKSHFEEYEIVELTMLTGATMMLNRYATAMQLPTSAKNLARLREHGFISS